MPVYTFRCPDCSHEFEQVLKLAEYDQPQTCPECKVTANRILSTVSIVYKGDGWVSKDLRAKRQMNARSEKARARHNDQKRDNAGPRLVPNVEGAQTDSWAEARSMAASKGKDTSSYEPLVKKEQAGKIS